MNRYQQKTTRYYIDEFHLLLREEQTAAYSIEIWKRFRKWGGIPTGITQNVKDLLASREVENIFENSEYICMLNQAAGDREILAQHLGISPHQLRFVTRVGEGQGLIFYGSMVMPFVDHFPKDTKMYQIMTTKLLETVPQAEPEETGAESEAVETENASGEAETDVAETAAVKKPLSDSTKKKTGKRPAAETENLKAKQEVSETTKPKATQPKDPDEALLKGVSDLLPRKGMEWSGTATELLEKLGRPDISPNIATRKLNENAEKLLSDYGVSYERTRNHRGRLIKLTRVAAKNRKKSAKKKEGDS